MSKIIESVGLSLERQWDIYQNIRSSVSDISKADIVAPLPKQKLVSKKRMIPLLKKELALKKRNAKVNGDVFEPDVE